MKSLLIIASVVALAFASPVQRALVTPGVAGPAPAPVPGVVSPGVAGPAPAPVPGIVEPGVAGPAPAPIPGVVDPGVAGPAPAPVPGVVSPGVAGPAPAPEFVPIAVGPAILPHEPISVGPAIVDNVFEPIAIGPAIIAPAPVATPETVSVPTGTPLVQIILNIQSAGQVEAAPVVVAPETAAQVPEIAPTPVQVVEQPFEPISVGPAIVDTIVPEPVVIGSPSLPTPIIPEPVVIGTPVIPEPVVVGAPIIPAPAITLPETLN